MRITGGSMRGRVVPGRVGPGVRPTASRVREALFSMVGQDLAGWTVLDAFGGSGLLSFEALSRGALVTTVERHRPTAQQIRTAARALGVSLDVQMGDAKRTLSSGSWDLVILDPPYEDDALAWAECAAGSVERVLVIEHAVGTDWPETIGTLVLDRSRRHGDSVLTVYRPRADAGVEEAPVVGDDASVIENDG